jgi:hypothetical protein
MKYVIFFEPKEPAEEYAKKMAEIEKGRIERGETLSQQGEPSTTYFMLSERKGFHIVDTDVSKIVKWVESYSNVFEYKIYPIMTREEWEKAAQE